MATQGVLSIIDDGNVIIKAVAGSDGQKIPNLKNLCPEEIDVLSNLYRDKFHDPKFNPRWQ